MNKTSIGILGCGAISKSYLNSFTGRYAPFVTVAACADILPAAAAKCAETYSIPRILTPDELLADPAITILVNLTIPEVHYDLNKRALLAGKHVYCEKPLALTAPEAIELGRIAQERGLMLSCAPDTILGSSHQTARKFLDAGKIGQVRQVAAWCSLNVPSRRYYRPAVGPILDFGPYYIGAFTGILGPVTCVSAVGSPVALPDPDKSENTFIPETPAHVSISLQFASGATGSLGLSSDALMYESHISLIGTKGRLSLPDPNQFSGSVTLTDYSVGTLELECMFDLSDRNRGAGVTDMALAILEKRPHRLGTDWAVHTTEVLVSILESLRSGHTLDLTTTCHRPAPMSPKTTNNPFALQPA